MTVPKIFTIKALAKDCSIESFPILDESEDFHNLKQKILISFQNETFTEAIQISALDEGGTKNESCAERTKEQSTRKHLRQQRLHELERKRSNRPTDNYTATTNTSDHEPHDWKPPIESMKGWDIKHLLHKILLQYEFLRELKMKFNQKLMSLLQEKDGIINFLIECNQRIRDITEETGDLYPEEYFSNLFINFPTEKNTYATGFEPHVITQKKWIFCHNGIENLLSVEKEELMRHRALLRHELNQLLLGVKDRVSLFDTLMQTLKVEHDTLMVDLSVQEIRLIALFQHICILVQTESKERLLYDSYRKAMYVLDDVGRLKIEKQKELDETKSKFDKMKRKESEREKSLQSILSKCVLHYNKLLDMYTSDDKEHPFPPGCPTKYYEAVLNLRISRQTQERIIQELKNNLDVMHRNMTSLVEEKERSTIEATMARKTLDSFLQEKVDMLSKVQSAFVTRDGCLSAMDSTKFMVCSRSKFETLKQKRKEIKTIISKEKSKIKSLQSQQAEMDEEIRNAEERISNLHQSCVHIQKLKLGRVLELEALYAFLDKNDANEDSKILDDLQKVDEDHKLEIALAEKRLKELKTKLKDVTKTNTSLLQQIGKMKEKQSLYSTEKERHTKYVPVPQNKCDNEIQELRNTVSANSIKLQELRSVIDRLQRKTGSIFDYHEV